jgi:hypothetical protein
MNFQKVARRLHHVANSGANLQHVSKTILRPSQMIRIQAAAVGLLPPA